MPEMDTQSLSLSLILTQPFLFSPFSITFHFFGQRSDRKNVTHGVRWHSWAEMWGATKKKEEGQGDAEMSPIQSQAMWAQT